jgi:Tetratricopeptide repeat
MKLLGMLRNLIPNLFRWGIISRWLVALCLWASSIQLAHPMLSPWPFMGAVTTAVVVLCLLVLTVRLAERVSPNRQIWMMVRPFLHVGDFIALAYIVCGVGLYLNGILTTSPPEKRFGEVLTVKEEPIQFGVWGPAGYFEIAVQEPDLPPQYLFVDAKAFQRVLPGQGISMVSYEGGLGLRWVDQNTILPDYKKTAVALTTKGIKDPIFLKRSISDDLSGQRFQQAYRKAQEYFDQEPGDISLAQDLASGAFRAGQPALGVKILEPFVSKHYNYKLYCSFGALLRDAGDVEKGIDYLKAAVGIDPQAADGYYLLGHTYKTLGYRDASRLAFTKLAELQPQYTYLLQQQVAEHTTRAN